MKQRWSFFSLILLLAISFSACDDLVNDDSSNPLVGTWSVSESSSEFGDQTYQVEITTEMLDPDFVRVYNFFGLGSWSYVTMEQVDQELIIPIQDAEGFRFLGTGNLNESMDQFQLSFTAEELSQVSKSAFQVDATFTKQ